MKEHPLPFTAEMVRAERAGLKTQTRRVIRPQPEIVHGDHVRWPKHGHSGPDHYLRGIAAQMWCPYGRVGDRLWVREAFRFLDYFDKDSPATVGDRCISAGYRLPWAPTHYEADGERVNWMHTSTPPHNAPPTPGRLRPPMFMPRWASRRQLEITNVHVQRVQEISEDDAGAEGAYPPTAGTDDDGAHFDGGTFHDGFRTLWDSINAKRAPWASNPWVWAITFRRVA